MATGVVLEGAETAGPAVPGGGTEVVEAGGMVVGVLDGPVEVVVGVVAPDVEPDGEVDVPPVGEPVGAVGSDVGLEGLVTGTLVGTVVSVDVTVVSVVVAVVSVGVVVRLDPAGAAVVVVAPLVSAHAGSARRPGLARVTATGTSLRADRVRRDGLRRNRAEALFDMMGTFLANKRTLGAMRS